jgi:tetratricopeptide (TPR) repeat protein
MTDDAVARARVLVAGGRIDEARALVAQVLAEDPTHRGGLLLEGRLRLEAREDREARRVLERAVEAWPRSAEAHSELARCLHALGEPREALARAEQARRLLDESENEQHAAAVYLTLVCCLRELRLFKEALDAAEEGLLRAPDAILAHLAANVEEELDEAQKERC